MHRIKHLFIRRVNYEHYVSTPRFYGVAWQSDRSERFVFMLIPFNVIVGALRRLYFSVRHGIHPHEMELLRLRVKQLEDGREYHFKRAQELESELFALRGLEPNESGMRLDSFQISLSTSSATNVTQETND